MKEHRDLTVLIEQDTEGGYIARVPELENCRVVGKSKEEVVEKIKSAILRALGTPSDSASIRLEDLGKTC